MSEIKIAASDEGVTESRTGGSAMARNNSTDDFITLLSNPQAFFSQKDQVLQQLESCVKLALNADFNHLSDGEATAIRWLETFEDWSGSLGSDDLFQVIEMLSDLRGVTKQCRAVMSRR